MLENVHCLKMSTTGKLSNFRQLSLICGSPSPHPKRQGLKKQFSEDIPDFKDPWLDQGPEIYFNATNKRLDKTSTNRPPPVKIAWSDKTDLKNDKFALNDEVIIKKCTEIKRVPGGKLSRHPSLEKDSILNSKPDQRSRTQNGDKENDKTEAKPNLQIFLAHNTQEYNDGQALENLDLLENRKQSLEASKLKYLQPLVSNFGSSKAFQIRKSNSKKPLESPKAVEVNSNRPNFSRSNTIVVVPMVEKRDKSTTQLQAVVNDDEARSEKDEESNGINVIIRPMTAQTRREKFQKRNNSAFHGTSKETTTNVRPPLVRSSSAPSIKPDKGKFLATKRKLKNGKKVVRSPKGDHSPHTGLNNQEWKNAAQTASEIITMVSLISPSGSENEDESDDDLKTRPKSALKREDSVVEKTTAVGTKEAISKDNTKNVSLRKTMKSVSFQQSSIHAVRSFSASFPARRGSMATALSLGNHGNTCKLKANSAKAQEKRGTNPGSPDADERVPKRRLLRSNSNTVEKKNSASWQKAASQIEQIIKSENLEELSSTFTVDIQTKTNETDKALLESSVKLDLEENVILITPLEKKRSLSDEETTQIPESSCETPKEKQCWEMYCKMSEKGINVSYDTILRGMLTPTEYRIRRRASIAEEMHLLMNPPLEENKAYNDTAQE